MNFRYAKLLPARLLEHSKYGWVYHDFTALGTLSMS